jgi:hypothetical protein
MKDKSISKSFHFASYTEKDSKEKVHQKGFVEHGKDNDFSDYLNELYNTSATHHALVDSIAYMIYGDGLTSQDVNTALEIEKLRLNETALKAAVDLKIHGGYYLECIWSADRSKISEVNHIPFQKIRVAEKNDDGEIDGFWYSDDWENWRNVKGRPEYLCKFDIDKKVEFPQQVLYVKPFTVGSDYYPKPDYVGAINYIELEREVSAFHINNIKNGLFPSAFLIWKNGIPSITERNRLTAEMENDLAGAKNAGKIVNLFADDSESAPEVVAFNSNDADSQYEFLSKECTDKIMIGHRVVTPALFGVKTAGQLGQQGELEIGEEIFNRTRIKPLRKILLHGFQTILTTNGMSSNVGLEKVQLSKDPLQELIEAGEEIDEDEWEIVSQEKIEGRPFDIEKELFARVPSSNPNGRSQQDNRLFKVRYAYAPNRTSDDSREFCKKMVSASKVYRFEDINAASDRAVNPGWGLNGADTYDLWLYKGGGNCHHFWERRVYLRRNNKKISVNEARRIINQLDPSERDEVRLPQNDPRVAQRPTDMPNNGFLNPR